MATTVNSIRGQNFIVHPFHIEDKHKSGFPKSIEKIMNVQKIIVFINGNTFFSGKNVPYDSQKYKSLKEFFLDLAALLPRDANLAEGIRRLFTPRGRHIVRSLDELKCGNIYVCAGAEPFRNVEYKFRRSIQQISSEWTIPTWIFCQKHCINIRKMPLSGSHKIMAIHELLC